MGEVSIGRCRATIPGASAFAILRPHSEQILATWKREVRSLVVAYEAVFGQIRKVAAPAAHCFGGTAKRERIEALGLSVPAATSRYPVQPND